MGRAFVIIGTIVFVVFYGAFLRNSADAGLLWWPVLPLTALGAQVDFLMLYKDSPEHRRR